MSADDVMVIAHHALDPDSDGRGRTVVHDVTVGVGGVLRFVARRDLCDHALAWPARDAS